MKFLIFFALLCCGVLAEKNAKVLFVGNARYAKEGCFRQRVSVPPLKKKMTIYSERPKTQRCVSGQYTVCLTRFASFTTFQDKGPEVKLLKTSNGAKLVIKPSKKSLKGYLTVCDETKYTGLNTQKSRPRLVSVF